MRRERSCVRACSQGCLLLWLLRFVEEIKHSTATQAMARKRWSTQPSRPMPITVIWLLTTTSTIAKLVSSTAGSFCTLTSLPKAQSGSNSTAVLKPCNTHAQIAVQVRCDPRPTGSRAPSPTPRSGKDHATPAIGSGSSCPYPVRLSLKTPTLAFTSNCTTDNPMPLLTSGIGTTVKRSNTLASPHVECRCGLPPQNEVLVVLQQAHLDGQFGGIFVRVLIDSAAPDATEPHHRGRVPTARMRPCCWWGAGWIVRAGVSACTRTTVFSKGRNHRFCFTCRCPESLRGDPASR